jgi:hypothetical protein
VLATFGRGFWVLDDLQFLEQLGTGGAASVTAESPYLFKPQQAWVTTGGRGFGGGGASLAQGVSVFFHLPDDYNGSTPVKLDFTTPAGALIRSVTLHPRASRSESGAQNQAGGGRGRGAGGGGQETAAPGMNRFQWDMRFPEATEVAGLYHSGFSASNPIGPEVTPGTYKVTLSYGGTTQTQPVVIKLDPRLHTTAAELQTRFALLMRLHDAVNKLDTSLNQAISARDSLAKSLADGHANAQAQATLDNLNRDIDKLVDLRIQSSEGALVYPPRLRAWLSAITGQVEMAPVAPTAAMVQVGNGYIREAGVGVARLQADLAAARGVVP